MEDGEAEESGTDENEAEELWRMWPIEARPGFVLKFPIQSPIACVALEALYYWAGD